MNQVLLKIENYIFNLYKDNLSLDYTYHNFIHTAKVVEAIKDLLSNENISKLLRDELSKTCEKTFSDYKWNSQNRNYFLNVHYYFTNSTKKFWLKGKENNFIIIQNNIKEISIIGKIPNKFELKKKKKENIVF